MPIANSYTVKFLLSADALFDTRLATVALLDSEYSTQLVIDPKYYTRDFDYFKKGSKKFKAKDYESAYASRNKLTLKNATRTGIADYLNSILVEQLASPDTRHADVLRELSFNVWPYSFNAETLKDLEAMLMELMPLLNSVKVVSIPVQQLTPQRIKAEDYAFIIQYDFMEWYGAHATALQSFPIPRPYMVFAAILSRSLENGMSDGAKSIVGAFTPFKAFEYLMTESMQVTVRFEDVKHFCLKI